MPGCAARLRRTSTLAQLSRGHDRAASIGAHAARTASKYGVHVDEVRVDMREVKARINSVIKGIYRIPKKR